MDYSQLSNTELVRFCGQKPLDREAWMTFVQRFDGRIRLVVYRELKNKTKAENDSQLRLILDDLVQEVYVRLFEHQARALREFIGKNENSIYHYLGMIAKNTVLNYLVKRGAQKRQAFEQSLDSFKQYSTHGDFLLLHEAKQPVKNNVEESIQFLGLVEEVEAILNKSFKEKKRIRYQLLFRLYFIEGLAVETIQKTFFMELSKKRINNMIAEIKKILKKGLSASAYRIQK